MAAASPSGRTRAFISYSHADAKYLADLKVHLASLTRDGKVDVWDDTRIAPGTLWFEEIKQAIRTAKVAIFLVSPNFLASDFIARQELPALLAAARQEGALVLSVILRPCLFNDTELARYQTVNPPTQPLSGLSEVEQDKVWVRLSELVRDALKVQSKPPPQANPLPPTQVYVSPASPAAPSWSPVPGSAMLAVPVWQTPGAASAIGIPAPYLPMSPVQRWVIACVVGVVPGCIWGFVYLQNWIGVLGTLLAGFLLFFTALVAGWIAGKLVVQRSISVVVGIIYALTLQLWIFLPAPLFPERFLDLTVPLLGLEVPSFAVLSLVGGWLATLKHPYYRKRR